MKKEAKNKVCTKLKKVYTVLSSMFLMATLFALNVYAAGFDTAGLKTGIQTGLIAVCGIGGAGYAVFGVIDLVQANGEQDPNAKNAAIKKISAGVGVIIVGAILIPVFISAIDF